MFCSKIGLIILLLLIYQIFAEADIDDTVVSLDKIVVTATRTSRKMSKTPASISVISKEDIAASPAKNIDDLLEKEVGIQMKRVVGIGEGVPSDIMIRGIPGSLLGSRVLILIDGIPTNASGTPFLILNEVPLEVIQSVEIVRGPYSSLYGANAFAGVINIRTLEGYGRLNLGGALETSVPFTLIHNYANDNPGVGKSFEEAYWYTNVAAHGGNERLNYLLNGGFRTVGNYLMNDSAIRRDGEEVRSKDPANHDYQDFRLFGKFGLELTDKLSLQLNGRFFDSELGYGRTRQLIDTTDIITAGRKWIVNPSLEFNARENLTIRGGYYYRGLIGEFWNEEPLADTTHVPSYWESIMKDWQVETQCIWQISHNNVFTGGIDFLNNNIEFGDKRIPSTNEQIPGSYSNDAEIKNSGFYLQDEIRLFERFTAVPGFRFDYHSSFGTALSPKLGLLYDIHERVRLRGSAGRAFRAPTLTELYMPETMINPTFTITANPDLTPEYLWAYDLGVEYSPQERIKLQLGVFYNDMKDLIGQDVDVSDLSNPKVTHKNSADAWSRGIEFDAEVQPLNWLNISGNAVFQQSRDLHASEIASYFGMDDSLIPLDYIPNFSADLGVTVGKTLGKCKLHGTLSESFVGERSYQDWSSIDITDRKQVEILVGTGFVEVTINPPRVDLDPYFRTDLSLKLDFPRHLWVSLNVQNLFDAEFEEYGGSRAPGRFASIAFGGDISLE